MKKTLQLVTVFVVLFTPVLGSAQAAFYGRAGVGLGITFVWQEDDGVEARATGFALPIDLALGVRLTDNLAINGDVILTPILAGGGSAESAAGEVDLDEFRGLTRFFGIGATYFPSNTSYLALSIGLGAGDGSIEVDSLFNFEVDLESDLGFGLAVQGGTIFEGSVVDFGLGGILHFMSLPPDVGDADNTNYVTIAAMFSVII